MGKGTTPSGYSWTPYEGSTMGQAQGTQNFGGDWQDLGPKGKGKLDLFQQKKGAPPPPDYYGAALAQGQSGQQSIGQQTQANRPNQWTSFGGENWVQGPDGQWTQKTTLNPTLNGALGNVQNQAANNAANGPQNSLQAQQQAIDANYNQAARRLNPQWAQSDEQLGAQLANQGIAPGSAAYNTAMANQSQAKNDAYSSAMNNAIGMGNQTAQMQLAEQMAPYQQMGALQGLQNGLPGFNAAGAYQPTDYLGAAEAMGGYGLQQSQLNHQQAQDVWSDFGQLGQAASDERIKTDIKRLPIEARPGVPLATFKFKHAPESGHHLGVIAQDVEKVAPHAVHTGPEGIKRVDYDALKPFSFSGKKK